MIRHLSLRGWLWWIHSSRSNATLQVRAPDGGGGKIWCTKGDVIDAEWGGRAAEEALGDMLLLESGTVTVDFERFERRRRIVRSTRELLQVADGEPSLATEAAHAEAVLAASPTGKVRSEPFRQSILFATGNLPLPAAASRQPKPQRRRLSRGEYIAVVFGVTALALAGFTFGRLRATNDQARMGAAEQPVTQQKRSGLRPPVPTRADPDVPTSAPSSRELPVIPFAALEVEPGHAQIWLDRELVGTGRVQLGAIQDGALHELRFVAPEHETKSLFFRDTPPTGRVQLKRIDERSLGAKAPTSAATAETARAPATPADASQPAEAELDAPKKVAQRRAPAPAPPRVAPRARAIVEDPPPAAAEKPSPKKSPQVQLIEVHTPRVQVLD